MSTKLNIGILSLQGAFDLHAQVLEKIGVGVSQVRRPEHLDGIDGIILPGGESTVMNKLLKSSELFVPLDEQIKSGLPTFGTCAGLIILADVFRALDVQVERNAYGPQIESFETEVTLVKTGEVCRTFFIRAPKIISVGQKAQVLATLDNEVVGVIQDNVIGTTFHPEVAKSPQIHEIFVELIIQRLKSNA